MFYFSLLKETHLVCVEALTTTLANNPIFFKIDKNIALNYVFHQIFMDINSMTSIENLITNRKIANTAI